MNVLEWLVNTAPDSDYLVGYSDFSVDASIQ